ncbi:unnamed protein product, partial [Prorocentrum cordatum]
EAQPDAPPLLPTPPALGHEAPGAGSGPRPAVPLPIPAAAAAAQRQRRHHAARAPAAAGAAPANAAGAAAAAAAREVHVHLESAAMPSHERPRARHAHAAPAGPPRMGAPGRAEQDWGRRPARAPRAALSDVGQAPPGGGVAASDAPRAPHASLPPPPAQGPPAVPEGPAPSVGDRASFPALPASFEEDGAGAEAPPPGSSAFDAPAAAPPRRPRLRTAAPARGSAPCSRGSGTRPRPRRRRPRPRGQRQGPSCCGSRGRAAARTGCVGAPTSRRRTTASATYQSPTRSVSSSRRTRTHDRSRAFIARTSLRGPRQSTSPWSSRRGGCRCRPPALASATSGRPWRARTPTWARPSIRTGIFDH